MDYAIVRGKKHKIRNKALYLAGNNIEKVDEIENLNDLIDIGSLFLTINYITESEI
jgi:hypothetical protein